jgi:glycosyltransferase 2 family protein
MMKKPARWVLQLTRLTLCLAAIVFIVYAVTWYDYATLADAQKSVVRVLDQNDAAGTIDVELDGQRTTLAVAPEKIDFINGQIPNIRPGILSVVRRMDLILGLLSILIFFPVPVLQSIRLVWMLAVQDVKLTYWNAIKLSYAGNFFNFAMPGMVGGDLIKAYYITRFTPRKTEAVTIVFLDRVIGLLGLVILSTVTMLIAWNGIEWPPAYRHTVAVILIGFWSGLCLGCVVLFSGRLRRFFHLSDIAARLPASDQILRIGRAAVSMRRHKWLVFISLVNTLVLQFICVVAAHVMARALHMQGHASLYYMCVPLGFLIGAFPFTPPQAFGVMEGAYIIFFSTNGLNPTSSAVAFALANRLVQLIWSLPGVLVPMLGAHLPSQTELAELSQVATESNGAGADETGPVAPGSKEAAT